MKEKETAGASPPSHLRPNISTLAKLGAIAVHIEEYLSEDGHEFDKIAIQQLLQDPDIVNWIEQMHQHALLPRKRR